MDVASLDRASAEASMSLEQAVHPAVDLERASDTSRHDGQVVGGIAAASVLPVDEPRWMARGEEDVLSEEIRPCPGVVEGVLSAAPQCIAAYLACSSSFVAA